MAFLQCSQIHKDGRDQCDKLATVAVTHDSSRFRADFERPFQPAHRSVHMYVRRQFSVTGTLLNADVLKSEIQLRQTAGNTVFLRPILYVQNQKLNSHFGNIGYKKGDICNETIRQHVQVS